VGPEQQQYHLHKALLTHHSEYFLRAFNGSWKEAEDRIVTLEDVGPVTFGIFVEWLYTQNMPTFDVFVEMGAPTKAEDRDDDPYITALTQALVFGDRFLAHTFH
jgi:hypothetical protein